MEIKNLIKLFNGSQKEMAAKLGTTESRISEYKNGKFSITVKKLRKWCDILGIDIKEVIGRSEQFVCNCQGCGEVKKIEYCEKCYAETLPDISN